jgi:translation initiation factor IF-2
MNVTELARKLKITPKELLEKLPLMGFHVGLRAIKIDPRTAQRILKEWHVMKKKLDLQTRSAIRRQEEASTEPKIRREVKVPNLIVVRDFATILNIPVNKVLGELMKNSIFASLNQQIDFETASIIGADLGFDILADEQNENEADERGTEKLQDIINKTGEASLVTRPPVIVVMGHVDHGKTKLLDAIRQTDVVAGEAGGITQHIGAYQVTRKDKVLTFIDTPGHEAFTAMRSRGAKIADVAILVVAADDGVMPQTVEAYRIIEAAKLPFVVAINKIDKPDANLDRVKQDLSSRLNLVPEDWGGKTICAPISARVGTGIEDLLDMILLTADVEVESMRANPNAPAAGTIIESHVDKGAGPVATVLVQNGTLRVNDSLVFNGIDYGKVRNLKNYRGETILEAGPSTPVKIIGLKIAPEIGDILESGEGTKTSFKNFKKTNHKSESKFHGADDDSIKKVNLIIRGDVLGSVEAIEESLAKIASSDVRANIISRGLGNINEGDIIKAETTKSKVLGFNVKASPQAEQIARDKNVVIKNYRIIYNLINDVKAEMQNLLEPEIKRVELGKLEIKAIFRTEGKEQIFGGVVKTGLVEKDAKYEIERNQELVGTGFLLMLQSGRMEVSDVQAGQECGMKGKGDLLEIGDILYFYKEDKIVKKL